MSQSLILVLFLHMLRVVFTGSYKPPRQMNWLVGVGSLLLTQLIAFMGYLLPWNQNGYWTTVVGTNLRRGDSMTPNAKDGLTTSSDELPISGEF
ncbi:MAG: cytochrome b N-terminal domain-containing protein [Thermoguttaceae bacterium]|nr:cytochrome b N-terminal domain-containing protein [Thermoguttaceae bacterium]